MRMTNLLDAAGIVPGVGSLELDAATVVIVP